MPFTLPCWKPTQTIALDPTSQTRQREDKLEPGISPPPVIPVGILQSPGPDTALALICSRKAPEPGSPVLKCHLTPHPVSSLQARSHHQQHHQRVIDISQTPLTFGAHSLNTPLTPCSSSGRLVSHTHFTDEETEAKGRGGEVGEDWPQGTRQINGRLVPKSSDALSSYLPTRWLHPAPALG